MALAEKLKMARTLAGLSQQTLADKVGVSKMSISKYENDRAVPGSAVLLALATALEKPTSFFFGSAVREVSAVRYRCKRAISRPERRRAQAQAQDWIGRYFDVQSLAGDPLAFVPPAIDTSIRVPEDVESAAEGIRDVWQLGQDPIDSLVNCLEDHGIPVGLIEGDDSVDALSFYLDGQPFVTLKRGIPGDRQRFSLAHELGHILLEVSQALDAESVINRFAGALLVPEHSVFRELGAHRRSLSIEELEILKLKHGLSMLGWVRRAEDLRIISAGCARDIRKRFTRQGWNLVEPGRQVPSEEPTAMVRAVYRALAEGIITRSRAMELLGEPLATIA